MAEHDDVDGVSCTGSGMGPSSSAAAVVFEGGGESEKTKTLLDIPIVAERLTFDESLAAETQKLDELADTERRRQWRRWRLEVDLMREEIVPLDGRRAARRCRSQSPTVQGSTTSTTGQDRGPLDIAIGTACQDRGPRDSPISTACQDRGPQNSTTNTTGEDSPISTACQDRGPQDSITSTNGQDRGPLDSSISTACQVWGPHDSITNTTGQDRGPLDSPISTACQDRGPQDSTTSTTGQNRRPLDSPIRTACQVRGPQDSTTSTNGQDRGPQDSFTSTTGQDRGPLDSTTSTAGERRQPRLPRNYFRRFFDTSGFDQRTIRVSVERGTLVLGVQRLPVAEQTGANENRDAAATKNVRAKTSYYRFPIPPSVDLATIRAVLSTDSILLVEADTGTGALSSPDQSLGSSGTESGTGQPVIAKREKIGKPVFRDDDDGKRRMHLLVDVGDSFRPNDIYVQAIKSDRFQVRLPVLLLFK